VIAQGVLQAVPDPSAVVALATVIDGRATLVVAASAGAVTLGVHAGDLVKQASVDLGGGGGGKPALAQGGGPDATALETVMTTLRDRLGQVQ